MNEIKQTKTCSKCGIEKSIDNYNKDKQKRDGLTSKCKECYKIYTKKNSKRIKKYLKGYRKGKNDKANRYSKEYRNSNALYNGVYHLLTIDEKPRLAKDDVSLEVKCKYCDKYFIPTKEEVYGRTKSLSGKSTGDGFLYCSEGCKYSCPIYRQHLYPKDHKPATGREVQPQLRKLVLERDNWICQKCGRTDTLHCHHIDPVKNNPIESADIDNCITFCISCHKEVHQQDGCKTGQLVNLVC